MGRISGSLLIIISSFMLWGCSKPSSKQGVVSGSSSLQTQSELSMEESSQANAKGLPQTQAASPNGVEGQSPAQEQSPSRATSKINKNKNLTYEIVEWTDLLPDDDLHALENPPEYIDDIEDGSEQDQVYSQLKAEDVKLSDNPVEARYQKALISKDIRPEFDGRTVKIPGFIVPLIFDDNQTITTFFLVPFFGACLHMPPPPPNQIIYAEYEPGTKVNALYDPFWISGTLSTSLIENDLATAAYSITVDKVEPYTDYVDLPEVVE